MIDFTERKRQTLSKKKSVALKQTEKNQTNNPPHYMKITKSKKIMIVGIN